MRIKSILFACLFAILAPAWGEQKMMAVIDVLLQGEAKKIVTPAERQYLSSVVREQASKALGNSVEILSQAKFRKLVKANEDGCSDAGCFSGFIEELGVSLGAQPTITFAFGRLKFTLEIADNRTTIVSRTISVPATTAGMANLGEQCEALSAELFNELAARLGIIDFHQKMTSVVNNVNTMIQIEFAKGIGSFYVDHLVACLESAMCQVLLTKGPHQITLSQKNFEDSSFVIQVPQDSNDYEVALRPHKMKVQIRAQDSQTKGPVNAVVFLDSTNVGTTPWSGEIILGKTRIDLKSAGYLPVNLTSTMIQIDQPSLHISMEQNHRLDVSPMVQIPAGCSVVYLYPERQLQNNVQRLCFHDFWLDQHEVSYGEFVRKEYASYSLPSCGDDCAVVMVDWYQAREYCESQGKRLPTDGEWEYAAKAGIVINTRDESSNGNPVPLDSVFAGASNNWGLFGMFSNVSEWTADWFDPSYLMSRPMDNPNGPAQGSAKIIRGSNGSLAHIYESSSTLWRLHQNPNYRSMTVGFRCAL